MLTRSSNKNKATNDATLLEFRKKMKAAEDMITKLGFSLREIQEMKKLI